jgi:hypothetical protein
VKGLSVLLGFALVACSSTTTLGPNRDPALTLGRAYKFRLPTHGCGAPIIRVDHVNWEPTTPWTRGPMTWPEHRSGHSPQYTYYVTATVRRVGDRLIVSLPNGVKLREYRRTKASLDSDVCA